jgi:Mg2+-importing ATPase
MSEKDGGSVSQDSGFDYAAATNDALLAHLKTSEKGLSHEQAEKRLKIYGYNEVAHKEKLSIPRQILSKILNPLDVVLIVIAAFSFYFGAQAQGIIVLFMAFLSVILSFVQEYKAGKEAEKLSAMVHTRASIHRAGVAHRIEIKKIVPGDIIELSAGDMVPADMRIVSSKDLFLNQAALTGESFPLQKIGGPIREKTSFEESANIVFMGSTVVSGSAIGAVINTGLRTRFGEISRRVSLRPIETNFDKGLKGFTYLMIRFMMVLVILVFALNALIKGDLVQALMFSLAVAVGLTPEMLPMLVTVNLSKGAIAMGRKKVIVKRLDSIQNLGAMDILCTDKTGTLTMDKIVLEKHIDVAGNESQGVLRHAYLNSLYETGLKNLLDKAILKHEKVVTKEYRKVDEIPFDFTRRIMSVIVESEGINHLISKGAEEAIFARCDRYELNGQISKLNPNHLTEFTKRVEDLQAEGFRVLAIAHKDIEKRSVYSKDDENSLILLGFVAFLDPPKPSSKNAIEALKKRGIETIILTGDNALVTKKICSEVGLDVSIMVTGDAVEKADDASLRELVKTATVFARLSPMQKERVINAMRSNGHVVGYLGDGINDAPSLKSSDVGISVNNAVDIAKESADIILLEKNLMILDEGVVEGRKTFGNIIKYIKMGSSSNFGNMFSMLGASIFLPFLPMLPVQILVNNFLYDMSQIGIPTDEVDSDYLNTPRQWKIGYIKKYMIIMGPISSIFDFITFAVMWFIFSANNLESQALFHTGWFLESLCTQTLVIHVIRTNKIPFIQSRPSKLLMLTSVLILLIGLALPFTSIGKDLGFVEPPPLYYAALILIIGGYLLLVQFVKTLFIKRYGHE